MRILAIDDDPVILELLTMLIESENEHKLETEVSGLTALETLQMDTTPRFDCFLVDVQMPEIFGPELVRQIKALPIYKQIPVMMLTAVSEKSHIDSAFAAGAVDYMTKPFDTEELNTRLGLVEAIAKKSTASNVASLAEYARQPTGLNSDAQPLHFYEPISIFDVENLIDIRALENYVLQLSRSSLFGSACFAFSIRGAFTHFQTLSEFEFRSMIADVAEVITDALHGNQFLMSYAGNGIFVCVTEDGWLPDMDELTDTVNLSLAQTELFNNKGEMMHLRVSGGEANRLVWRSGRTLLEALADAHSSAELAAQRHERELRNIWSTTQAVPKQVVH